MPRLTRHDLKLMATALLVAAGFWLAPGEGTRSACGACDAEAVEAS